MEKIATPWGTTGTPGQGITGAVEPKPTANPKPESKIPQEPPYAGDPYTFMDGEKAEANAAYARLVRADNVYREAIAMYNGALDAWRKTEFVTGKKAPVPIFAVSFAAALRLGNVEDYASLPFSDVAVLYEIPEAK